MTIAAAGMQLLIRRLFFSRQIVAPSGPIRFDFESPSLIAFRISRYQGALQRMRRLREELCVPDAARYTAFDSLNP